MRILLTGCTGYVGSIVQRGLDRKHELFAVSAHCPSGKNCFACDLRDHDAVARLADKVRPDVVIHAAGNKDITYCEKHPEEAFDINCNSVRNVALVFGKYSKIICLSTDYVFDGYRGRYREVEELNPITVYGKTKTCAEREGRKVAGDHFIILRLSALYDLNNVFIRYLNEKLSQKEQLECYTDTRYSPTYYKDFLRVLNTLLELDHSQQYIYHSCGEPTTRYDFAIAYAEAYGYDTALIRKALCKNQNYLYPDLSLDNALTNSLLGLKTTSTRNALDDMRTEIQK